MVISRASHTYARNRASQRLKHLFNSSEDDTLLESLIKAAPCLLKDPTAVKATVMEEVLEAIVLPLLAQVDMEEQVTEEMDSNCTEEAMRRLPRVRMEAHNTDSKYHWTPIR